VDADDPVLVEEITASDKAGIDCPLAGEVVRPARDGVAHPHDVSRGPAWPARHLQPLPVRTQICVIGMR
jgi:hypothetical protein